MAKRFNEQTLKFKDDKGIEHKVSLYMTRTPNYTTEHAFCEGKEGTYKWCNRPWQSFDYEIAMQNMIEKLPKAWQKKATATLIDKTQDEIEERCESMLKAFDAAHNSLSDKGKEFFAEHAPMMNSEEDVKTMTAMMQLGALMGM